jgi:DNA polymerase-3 subunit epsilon
MLPNTISFVDLETTGGRAQRDRIIEIGIVKVRNGEIVDKFETLLNPNHFLPPEIEVLTGIKAADLEDAPTFSQIAEKVQTMLEDSVFVAHNVRFDYGFLYREFERLNMPFSMKHFCTVKLSRRLFPQHLHHNLDAVKERLELECDKRHRAYQDAHLLYQFYQKIQTLFPLEVIEETVHALMKAPSLPPLLPPGAVNNLPKTPGVYIFYDTEHTPLYVGKSKNIHDRVLSHFSSDIRHGRELTISQQLASIETHSTPGELGALFLESHLVKTLMPIYNRKLRIKRELIALYQTQDKKGYNTIAMEPITKIEPELLENFLGFFSSRQQAKEYLTLLANKHGLCKKLLGLEKSPTSCFGYRLESCKGACMGHELPLLYNLRFLTAFSTQKIKPWPFAGTIAIEEMWEMTGEKEYLLFDKWCYLGSVFVDKYGDKAYTKREKVFDLDIYIILLGFMKKEAHLKQIKILNDQDVWEVSEEKEVAQLFENSHI